MSGKALKYLFKSFNFETVEGVTSKQDLFHFFLRKYQLQFLW